MGDKDVVMKLLVPAKVLRVCNVWSYEFYDMMLSTD